jgi:benzoate/toluate 1,2-dioxygenase reductase subunit
MTTITSPDRGAPADRTADVETYSVALSFEDGVTRFINCRSDQTVADASYRQRINIPLDCRDGACGTCKALCESGVYDGGSYIDDALSPDEAAAGYVLPCSARPRSDLVLQIASTSDVAKTQAATYSGTVSRLNRLSATTVALGVEVPNRSELTFLPGQYVNIAVPGTDQTRSYSFSNAPGDDLLTFLVKLTPGGAMSEYLSQRAAVGDDISFTGPNGSFFLRETDRPVLLLAGGTGLAPVLSMLRAMRDGSNRRKAHLIYGVGTDEDLVALDEIEQIASTLDGFSWDHCVSDPGSTAANKGYVTSLIAPRHLYDGDVAVYLCGPPPMVESVRSHVAKAGIEPTGFYYEKFALAHAGTASQSTSAPAAPTSSEQALLPTPDARAIAGQVVLPPSNIIASPGAEPGIDDRQVIRSIVGQPMLPATTVGAPAALDPDDGALISSGARRLAGQALFADSDPEVTAAPPAARTPVVSDDGYQIGEEHPGMAASDALFEARQALELGALELTMGRLNTQQLAGYRLLAESTLPYVDGDRFVDAAQYTETNAAFHDYLFTLTGNKHLLQAYQALDVKGRMSEALRHATWCHPLCAQDHVNIVNAFEAGDRTAARTLFMAHAECSKQTMRRAMSDLDATRAARRPRFVTPGRFDGKVVVVTGAAQGIGEQTARRISAEGGTLVLADRA